MASLKDLARACGLSVATVSKALNGQSDVSAATRDRVQKVAAQMGYVPNMAARAIRTKRMYLLGILLSGENGLSALLNSFRTRAEQLGYDVVLLDRSLGGREMSYLEHCRYRGVDGVFVASADFTDPQVEALINSGIPVVTLDHTFNNRMAVLSDHVQGISELVRYAYAKGHRKIAYLHGERNAVTEKRLAGFYNVCDELGIEPPESYLRACRYQDAARCAEETRALLQLKKRPTCILFPDDFSALGGCNAILDAGLRIPEDVSVMGYDGLELTRFLRPKLTTYHQNTALLGWTAAEKLVQTVERPRATLPEQLVIPGRLLEGDSVAECH